MRRLFAVIGHPIRHSLSPAMHTAAFRALGLDAAYVALDVSPARAGRVLAALHAVRMDGLNVTVPHKARVLRAVSPDAAAAAIGAVNTLAWGPDGWTGHNTDVAGFEQVLRQELKMDAGGTRVVVLGAGGAARAVVWALVRRQPARLTLVNRTRSHAVALARWARRAAPGVTVEVAPFEAGPLTALAQDAELLVNATSLGLKAGDPLPVPRAALHKRLVVCDLVYPAAGSLRGAGKRSPTTSLVAAARRRGALAVDGVPMLVYQGAESFRLWWDRPAPLAEMRRAVECAVRQRRGERPSTSS